MASRSFASLLLGTALALVGAGASASVAETHSAVAVRAAMTTAQQMPAPGVRAPSARGLFSATLSGRALSWRLTFGGLSSAAVSADVRVGARRHTGPSALRLCRPCRSGVQGVATLDQAAAAAVRRGDAYVDLRTRSNPRGEIRGQITTGLVPTLEILSPTDGATITVPAAVRFAVSGFALGEGGGHIEAFVRGVGDGLRVVLRKSSEPGLAYLPANKLLTGRRDLTFALVRADGARPGNPEAQATVYRLIIRGGR